jgi:TPR repeat protein
VCAETRSAVVLWPPLVVVVFLGVLVSVACTNEAMPEPCEVGAVAARSRDYYKAHLLWRLAAADASQKSWTQATLQCLRHSGIATTDKEAAAWLSAAGMANDSDALVQLGILYALGTGVEKNLGRAEELMLQAEKRGNESAIVLKSVIKEIRDKQRDKPGEITNSPQTRTQ